MDTICYIARLLFLARVLLLLVPGLASPCLVWAQSYFEDPQPGSFQSGIGIIRGWVCNASRVDIVVDETTTLQAAYGTRRDDTSSVCGDNNNGFGFQINWNNLGDGMHTVRVLADGVQFGSTTFTVATLGQDFLRGVSGTYILPDFPQPGFNITIRWEESLQNFVIEKMEQGNPPPPPPPP